MDLRFFARVGNLTYSIKRYYHPSLNREDEVVQTGLSLEEAQAHCDDPETHVPSFYFDGYVREH